MLQTVVQLREEVHQDPENPVLWYGLAEALNIHIGWLNEQVEAAVEEAQGYTARFRLLSEGERTSAFIKAMRLGLTAPLTQEEKRASG